MAHIVILGAGTGGMPGAYKIRDALSKSHTITVINASEDFQFMPSNPWLAVGWRTRRQITFPIRSHLERKGIQFIPERVEKIQPEIDRLVLEDGHAVDYDYLVIATGPKLAFDEVDGMGPLLGGYTHSVCTVDHAEKVYQHYQQFLQDPGEVIVGAVQGASCFGPAYEYAFVLDTDLRQRQLRDQVHITFVTSEPYLGHMGLGGIEDSQQLIEAEFQARGIRWVHNASVAKVDQRWMRVIEHNAQGEAIEDHQLPFRLAMLMPAFRGVDAVAQVEGLCDPQGFVMVNEHQRSLRYRNIFAAGVCIAIPPIESTPVPTEAPKTGYMTESMLSAIVHNIKDELAGKAASHTSTWNTVWLADMGDTGMAFVAFPQRPPRKRAWLKKGEWVHQAKVAYEKYFIRRMKTGSSEPFYEKNILKNLGIEHPKDENKAML